jgi:hypothetical protein
MIGMIPLSRGYEGMIPWHALDLLVLAVESFLQINQVNSVVVQCNQIMRLVNKCRVR